MEEGNELGLLRVILAEVWGTHMKLSSGYVNFALSRVSHWRSASDSLNAAAFVYPPRESKSFASLNVTGDCGPSSKPQIVSGVQIGSSLQQPQSGRFRSANRGSWLTCKRHSCSATWTGFFIVNNSAARSRSTSA